MIIYGYFIRICTNCLYKKHSWFTLKRNPLPHAFVKNCQYHNGIRVRFAPSPTGMLHLGGLRTVLYNYAFAHSQKGKFILRIEDTDQNRIVPHAIETLQEILNWIGLPPDEGPLCGGDFGPYIQSQRLHLYNEKIKILLENGSAYYCFCTEKRLSLIRKDAAKRGARPGYDNHCRSLTSAEIKRKLDENAPYVIRFKTPSYPLTFQDLICGTTTTNLSEHEGDPILIKSDGFPTYHFANVVDDHEMEITHVLRGVEWHISTVKHLLLYEAFGYKPPQFAHLPLLLNSDGSKLSKRQGDIGIEDFKRKGYYPEAILNFLASRGGGFVHEDKAIRPVKELIDTFSLERVNTNANKIDPLVLDSYNRMYGHHLFSTLNGKKAMVRQLRSLILKTYEDRLNKNELQEKVLHDEYIEKILEWSWNRIYTLNDLLKEEFQYLWIVPNSFDLTNIPFTSSHAAVLLSGLHLLLKKELSQSFSQENFNCILRTFAQRNQVKFSSLMKLIRVVLSNLQKGPSVAEMVEILGIPSTLDRLLFASNSLVSLQSESKKSINILDTKH